MDVLFNCMTYVDLNPIWAGIAELPEKSDYTSVQERIKQQQNPSQKSQLIALIGNAREEADQEGIFFHLDDYLALVDWTGRAIREDKRGYIPHDLQPILQRLNIDAGEWSDGVKYFGHRFPRLAGSLDRLEQAVTQLGQRWCQGRGHAKRLFTT